MKISGPLLLIFLLCNILCAGQDRVTAIWNSADYQKAISFLGKKDDSAFYYFNEITDNSDDSLKVAMAYYNMADIQSSNGDYFLSQETVITSLRHLNDKMDDNFYCLASSYNLLAVNSLNLKNFDAAIKYSDSALKFNRYPQYESVFLNNKALAYQKKGDYTAAIDIYLQKLEPSKSNALYYARIKSNLARTKWLANPDYDARSEFWEALEIRKRENDDWGLNASYAHLSDFYANINKDSALLYANRMYDIAKKLSSPGDQIEALQKLIPLSTSLAQKNFYFNRYQYLIDSLQTARSGTRNQLAVIQYDVEKSKSENFRLQQENSEKNFRLQNQRLTIYGIIASFIIVLLLGLVWYRKRKQKIAWETQNAIQKNQLKTSKKVHDVVANGLYRIMKDIEHNNNVEKNTLLDRIDILYEQSRDISYEPPTHLSRNFSDELYELLTSFDSSATRILVVGNRETEWKDIPSIAQKDIKFVLQELMVNMSKHSQARNVAIHFKHENDQLHIRYKDDGIGLPSNFLFGNGLKNTENRIQGIGGQITFINEEGLKIDISIPTSNPNDR